MSSRIIERMNDDYSDSIVSTLIAQHKIQYKDDEKEKLEVNGYFASSKGKLYI